MVLHFSGAIDTQRWMQAAAQGGDARAEHILGLMRHAGWGKTADHEAGLRLIDSAKGHGDLLAGLSLGDCNALDAAVNPDAFVDLQTYRRLARKGFGLAAYRLGVCRLRGLGVEQDYIAARRWFALAAKEGLADAQNDLGLMHHLGLGGQIDLSLAERLYRAAIANGHAGAQHNLTKLPTNAKSPQ
ncbi:tetratricopeptide repeat protein [Magnetofaba australis]|uniref:Sel1 domain-containing protein n=1 Tax=Magnetofaba australis IT-1 TaxID=1434232 RepID=A0A1Y2JYH5_9PROT|nr:tetratricopeptide repeat protein [Magnetofaba australis]OSM00009.1 hypothetical protein MAIT1_05441 [Magnetofaba australis IT-1]